MPGNALPTLPADRLRRVAQAILEAVQTPPGIARVVSDSLVEANLMGHDSHGVLRLPSYVSYVRQGQVKPAERPKIVARHMATARVDASWGWGQPAAHLAADTAAKLADVFGIGAVTIAHCNHVGRLGQYVESTARLGMIGLAVCNAEPVVAPFGGRERLLGTNPLAIGVPRAQGRDPLLVDFATAGVAEGKVRLARAKGETVAAGLILDATGKHSRDPNDFYAGGSLLPIAGHKGYGISLMIELLGGALSGGGPSMLPEYVGGNGTLILALNIAAFSSMERFVEQVEAMCGKVKAVAPAPGVDEVLLPGEPEMTTRRRRLVDGIPLPSATLKEIVDVAAELKIGEVLELEGHTY